MKLRKIRCQSAALVFCLLISFVGAPSMAITEGEQSASAPLQKTNAISMILSLFALSSHITVPDDTVYQAENALDEQPQSQLIAGALQYIKSPSVWGISPQETLPRESIAFSLQESAANATPPTTPQEAESDAPLPATPQEAVPEATLVTTLDTQTMRDRIYAIPDIAAPAQVSKTKEEVNNAINYHLNQFENYITLDIANFRAEIMPESTSQLEYAFNDGPINVDPGSVKYLGEGIMQLAIIVNYNEAGRILQSAKNGVPLAANDTKALALKERVDRILASIDGKSDTQKVIAIHDYIVLHTAYDINMAKSGYSAYGALMEGKASCQGYSEAMSLLLSLSGIENRLVWAEPHVKDKFDGHGFNKVKLDGAWYNVDCTADDPIPDVEGRLRHNYCLVTDAVVGQRYTWDASRYPAAVTEYTAK